MGHQITVSKHFRHKGDACGPGYEVIAGLRCAIAAAGDAVGKDVEISGAAAMARCERPGAAAYHGTWRGAYPFGDMEPVDNIGDRLAFEDASVRRP